MGHPHAEGLSFGIAIPGAVSWDPDRVACKDSSLWEVDGCPTFGVHASRVDILGPTGAEVFSIYTCTDFAKLLVAKSQASRFWPSWVYDR